MSTRSRRTRTTVATAPLAIGQPNAMVMPLGQLNPYLSPPISSAQLPVIAPLSTPTIGIDVPDYTIGFGPYVSRIAKGKYTELVTQEYVYDDRSGNLPKTECREYVRLRKMAAAILPMCPSENKYLLIRQFRYPAWHNAKETHPANSPNINEDGWLYEVIAGVIEIGETAERTVIREAEEEGGIIIDPADIRQVHKCMMTPGLTNEVITTFLGLVHQTSPIPQTGLVDQGEHIQAKWMTSDEIRQLNSQGLIRDAKTLIALYAARVL